MPKKDAPRWDEKDRIIFITGISIASILIFVMGIKSSIDKAACDKAYNAYLEYLEREGIDPDANALEDICFAYCSDPDDPTVPTNCKIYCNMREVMD